MAEKLKMQSSDVIGENISFIESRWPNVVKEVRDENGNLVKRVDFDALKQELSHEVISDKQERYQMTWPDKKKASLLGNSPISATLRPIREKSVDFDKTKNVYIEGDNLDSLKLLRETYLNKVKMIYVDPPYNTGNDFVYNDNFEQNSEEYFVNSGQYDDQGNRLFSNNESNGRFHTDWLNMIYPRLKIAKDLLTDDGVIFISIDDNELVNLTKVCDEIFGEYNHLGTFIVNSTPNARDYGHIGKMHEFALFYAKDCFATRTNMLPEIDKTFSYKDEVGGFNVHPLYNSNEAFTNLNRPNLYYPFYLYLNEPVEKSFYKIGLEKKDNSIEIFPPKSVKNQVQFVWRWGKEKAKMYMNKEIIGYKTNDGEYRIVQKMRHTEKIIRSLLIDNKYSSRKGTAEVESILKGKYFSFPKPLSLIEDFVRVGSDSNSIILDFFSGSATTAHAVMKVNSEDNGNRKFIMIQLPEPLDVDSEAFKNGFKNICDIGETRIRNSAIEIIKNSNLLNNEIDTGFRVLKLDSSNMKDVYYNPKQVQQSLLDNLVDNVKEDRTSLDLLFQVMLDLGIELSAKITEKTIDGKQVFVINDSYLVACFASNISEEVVRECAKINPVYVVFRDASFNNDSSNINCEQIIKTISPSTELKVI